METQQQKIDKLRQECWNGALHTFGKGYIFDNRSKKYGRWVNLLKASGIVVPTAIGGTALAYGYNSDYLAITISLAVPLTIAQLIISVFAVVFKWDDEFAYSIEASQQYSVLADNFKKLGQFPPSSFTEFEYAYNIESTKHKSRIEQDSKHNLKEWELRKGMRYALREFKRKCYGCETVPKSMKSTGCDICGKFKWYNLK
jgi:mobilome CxxCx(11)CxxC protein